MPEADGQCLAPTHRQSRDRPVLAVRLHGIVRFDVGDNVLQQVVFKAADKVAEPALAATGSAKPASDAGRKPGRGGGNRDAGRKPGREWYLPGGGNGHANSICVRTEM